VRVCSHHFLSVQFQYQPEHTVCGRMLWAEIHSVVADLPILGFSIPIGLLRVAVF